VARDLRPGIQIRANSKFRVQVRRNGTYQSKTFGSARAAEDWQRAVEGRTTAEEVVDQKTAKRTTLAKAYAWMIEGNHAGHGSHAKNRTLPIFGSYLQTDRDVGVQQVNLSPRIANIHHGIFNKATYYAISKVASELLDKNHPSRPAGVLLSVDWGGFVLMVPDPNNPNQYRADSGGDRWVGSIEFDSDARERGRKIHFKSVGSQAVKTRPFLEDKVLRRPVEPATRSGHCPWLLRPRHPQNLPYLFKHRA
jgi:hypothetical protein